MPWRKQQKKKEIQEYMRLIGCEETGPAPGPQTVGLI
jgi:hypothetical protein